MGGRDCGSRKSQAQMDLSSEVLHPLLQCPRLCWPAQRLSKLSLRKMKSSSTAHIPPSSLHAGWGRLPPQQQGHTDGHRPLLAALLAPLPTSLRHSHSHSSHTWLHPQRSTSAAQTLLPMQSQKEMARKGALAAHFQNVCWHCPVCITLA